MPTISYPYEQRTPDFTGWPVVPVVVINLLTKQSAELKALVDPGADHCSFSNELMDTLGVVDLNTLTRQDLFTAGGQTPGGMLICDYLAIGIVDRIGGVHFIQDEKTPVLCGFTPRKVPQCLLGRIGFLDLMKATFDGPRSVVRLEF